MLITEGRGGELLTAYTWLSANGTGQVPMVKKQGSTYRVSPNPPLLNVYRIGSRDMKNQGISTCSVNVLINKDDIPVG